LAVSYRLVLFFHMMVMKNGNGSNRGLNGTSDLTGLLWRHRDTAIKGCIFFFLITNMFYFATRYVELTNTVRRLEAEKSIACQESSKASAKPGADSKDKITEAEKKDEGPLLNYSQVTVVTRKCSQYFQNKL